ncbi:MAG: adenylate/guanylate cyclase domain-containing protein [Deltaproteobacteria bacterium]|nr:adenylate/guanylate cyclase domain-containing protein [Deltaproteobacteria bacterium]
MPFSPLVRKLFQGLASGAAGTALAIGLWAAGAIDRWEAITWDWRAATLARHSPAHDQITMILLDQDSLDWAQKENGLGWPWPRELYAAVISFCQRSGAKSLAFDVLFTEPSSYGVEDDAALARASGDYGHTAGAVALGRENGNLTAWPEGVPKPVFPAVLPVNASMETPMFPRAAFPVPELARAMKVLCNTQMNPDPDGIYRKAPLAAVFDGRLMPSLGLGAYLAAHPTTAVRSGPEALSIGEHAIPLSPDGSAILRFSGPAGTYRGFSAAAVIQSELQVRSGKQPNIDDPGAFRDKFVFFGFTAPGLFDLRPTSLDGVTPGVEIQATILDNLLSGNFIRKCPTAVWIAAALGLALITGMAGSVFSSTLGHVMTSLIFLTIPVVAALGSYAGGWSLPLVAPEIAVATVLSLVFIVNYATEGRQKRFIQGAFKQYLSPAVIDQLILHPERLRLGGERRVLSIFFSDLEGFTTISEKLDPEALTTLLNEYLTAMTDIIHEEAGTVDKFEGDAIIAFWNAPLEVIDHPLRVVRTALRCQEQLAILNPQFEKRVGRGLRMRIGVHTGSAVVGNMGSHSRFDYTMLGDAVNLAARLEGANKAFGTYVMISGATRQEIGPAFPMREIARLAVVGRKEPITVYEPMFPDAYENHKVALTIFDQGLRLFYAGRFPEAGEMFASIADQDPAAASYLAKCRHYTASAPDNWDGVWVMTSK